MTIGTTIETDAEVAAKLIAARPRPARYRWTCKRCGNPQDAEERPPSPQLCARCRSIVLDIHTEPATRPVYGDESEDDGEPITGPAPSERIQTDTSPSEAEAPKKKNAEEEVKMTATVEAPKKAAKPKAIEKKAQPAIPATTCLNPKCGAPVVQTGHGRRAIYCSGRCKDVVQKARARQRDKEAKAPAAGPFSCPNCPETFELERQRNGHLAWCGKKRAAAMPLATEAPNYTGKPGSVVDRAEKGDKAAAAELARPETFFDEAPAPTRDFAALGRAVGELVATKQAAYGDSFGRSGAVLKILYPLGIAPEQYDDALAVVRVVDKLFRVATDRDAIGESPWRDIAGYGLLGAARTAK